MRQGLWTLYPSLRGGNGNPGYLEGLYGEVDDVLAAARYLATRPDVDPRRIYLGGHSTGGTLALLVAESTHTFRAVFAFGPVKAMGEYGTDHLPFDYDNKQELLLRAPLLYLGSIQSPTFVFEGTDPPGNLESLRRMRALCSNPQVHFYEAVGLDHFSELAPVTPLVAAGIARDTKAVPHFSFITASPKIVPSTQ